MISQKSVCYNILIISPHHWQHHHHQASSRQDHALLLVTGESMISCKSLCDKISRRTPWNPAAPPPFFSPKLTNPMSIHFMCENHNWFWKSIFVDLHLLAVCWLPETRPVWDLFWGTKASSGKHHWGLLKVLQLWREDSSRAPLEVKGSWERHHCYWERQTVMKTGFLRKVWIIGYNLEQNYTIMLDLHQYNSVRCSKLEASSVSYWFLNPLGDIICLKCSWSKKSEMQHTHFPWTTFPMFWYPQEVVGEEDGWKMAGRLVWNAF